MKNTIKKILNVLNGVLKTDRPPLTPIPSPLILKGSLEKSGVSARSITSRVISRQSEAGAPFGDIFQNNSNVMESIIAIIVEEVVHEMKTECKVEVAIAPSTITITSTGIGNLGAPVVSQGTNTNIIKGTGIIR
jgi:hypothetical protein